MQVSSKLNPCALRKLNPLNKYHEFCHNALFYNFEVSMTCAYSGDQFGPTKDLWFIIDVFCYWDWSLVRFLQRYLSHTPLNQVSCIRPKIFCFVWVGETWAQTLNASSVLIRYPCSVLKWCTECLGVCIHTAITVAWELFTSYTVVYVSGCIYWLR